MSAFAEIGVAIVAFLIEVAIHLCALAVKPIRFLVSPSYRNQVRVGWRENRCKKYFIVMAGVASLVFLAAAGIGGVYFCMKPATPTAPIKMEAKVRRFMLEYRAKKPMLRK